MKKHRYVLAVFTTIVLLCCENVVAYEVQDYSEQDSIALELTERFWNGDHLHSVLIDLSEISGSMSLDLIKSEIDKAQRFYDMTCVRDKGVIDRGVLDLDYRKACKNGYSYLILYNDKDDDFIFNVLEEVIDSLGNYKPDLIAVIYIGYNKPSERLFRKLSEKGMHFIHIEKNVYDMERNLKD